MGRNGLQLATGCGGGCGDLGVGGTKARGGFGVGRLVVQRREGSERWCVDEDKEVSGARVMLGGKVGEDGLRDMLVWWLEELEVEGKLTACSVWKVVSWS